MFSVLYTRLFAREGGRGALPPASEGWRKVMFSLCPPFGGGVPCLRSGWGGGTLSQVWMGGYPISGLGGGCPIPGLDGGYPIPGLDRGTPTWSQVRMGGYLGYPPSAGWGTPHWGQDGGVPQLEQHGVYLLHSRRYASYIHAGGLSCSIMIRKAIRRCCRTDPSPFPEDQDALSWSRTS